MTHIHYKFSSSKLSYDTVVFDGPHITLTDLKRQIMGREKLRAADCDLQITNAQTKEEYTEGEGLIPKGSSVIVRRFPVIGVKSGSSSKTSKTSNTERSDLQAFGVSRAMSEQSSTKALSFFSRMQMANLVDADVSEEDKIRVMINQSSINLNLKPGPTLPENYTCYRCGNTGHHIRNCPVSGDKNFEGPPRIKKSTGIPRSFMVEVDDPNIKGVKLTNCGRYAIPAIDAEAYAIGKKEKPPFLQQERPKSESEEEPVPGELLCLICHDLLGDAVVIPCCGNSYCDDCIRSALLDSEDHVCPTCGQSDVSPDTLIANKSLRQTVNNFKKEPDCSKTSRKGCVTLNSKNLTPTPNPAVAPPPLSMKSQLHKPLQSFCSQKDSLLNLPKREKSPAASQSAEVPPEATEPAPAENLTNTSSQPARNQALMLNNENEGKTGDDSAAVSPPLLLSDKDPTDAPSQPEPQVNRTEVQAVSVTQRDSSSDSALGLSGSSNSLDSTLCSSSSSSFSCPTGSLTEPTTEQHLRTTSSSSLSSSFTLYSTAPPPLFPSPPVHTFVPTHQPHSSYPPRYPLTTTPTWKLPAPRGAPIPSLCSSTSTSSIPVLIPKEWYQYQKTERSPQGRSFAHSNSKTSKSKPSHSGSSSRSASRSRSRSRPCSPHSGHRNLHIRSNPSTSYGYKRPRSTTPSSSSSSRGAHSRSNSSPNHRKSRHHGKRSSSSSRGSKQRGDAVRSSSAQQTGDMSSLELDRQRYLQWKKEYQEWYDKYFSSFISHFHQMPLPPPPPDPQGSLCPPQGRRTAGMDGSSPSSETSSDSRSPPSRCSSSDAQSAASHPSSDSCSYFKANVGRSSPSHSSSDSRSTPTDDRAQVRDASVTVTKSEGAKELKTDNRQKLRRGDDSSQLHREQKKKKKLEGRAKDLLSSDSSDSTGDLSRDKKRRHTEPNPHKEGSPVRHQSTAGGASVQTPLKKETCTDKHVGKKVKEERRVKKEQSTKRGQDSDVKGNLERKDKVKPSKEPDRVETGREEEPRGSNAPESRSEESKKRKWGEKERIDRRSDPNQSSNIPKIKTTEPESHEKKSLKPSDRKKQKPEKEEGKTLPLSQRDVWEGGVKVIPQKKISININLCGKTKEKEENFSKAEICTQENKEQTGVREQEVNKDGPETEKSQKEESSPGNVTKVKPTSVSEEVKEKSNEALPRDDKHAEEMKESGGIKEKDEEDSGLRHCALTGEEEERETGEKDTVKDERRCRETRGEPWREEGADSQSIKNPDDGRMEKPRNRTPWTGSWEAEESQEMKTLEENSQGRAGEAQSQPAQVSHSNWENGEQSRAEKEIVGDADGVIHPQPSVTPAKSEAARKPEQKKQRSTDERRDRDRVTGRGRDKERRSTSSCSDWSVAPSGGSDQTDISVCPEREREAKRDRERTREADRQKDGKRLKQRPREEERRRDQDASVQKRSHSSCSFSSSSASHDKDRRDCPWEGEQDSSLSFSFPSWKPTRGNTCLPDQNAPKTHRHLPSLLKTKTDKDHFHYSNYHQRPSVNYREKSRPVRIQHSPPFVSHSYSEDRDLLLFESTDGPQRAFPDWGLTHESRAQRGERKEAEQTPKTMKDHKVEREPPEAAAGRGGGSRRDDRPRKLDERRRSSNDGVRSSWSHKNSKDDKREEEEDDGKGRQKKNKKEKGHAPSELLDVNL